MVRTAYTRDRLLQAGIRPSYPRIRIMDNLASRKDHPTAEDIFGSLVEEIPTLSRTTVYNSLSLLAKAGLVKIITIEDNEMRYDATVLSHGHFKCRECGRVYDFTVDIDNLEAEDLRGFVIEERDVYFRGVCSDCIRSKGQ